MATNPHDFMAVYECTICGGEWVWCELGGEAGPFCDECSRKVYRPRRPRKVRMLTPIEAARIDTLRSEHV